MEGSLIGGSQRQGVKPKMGKCKKCVYWQGALKQKKGVKQGLCIHYMCHDFGIGCAWKIESSGVYFCVYSG
jgi:hypothetical protein